MALLFLTILPNPYNKSPKPIEEIANSVRTNNFSRTKGEESDTHYNYWFDINNEYSNEKGDEFEKMDCLNGNQSSLIIQDENDNIVYEKKPIESRKEIALASYEDKNENNDSFANATNMYSVGTYKSGITTLKSWCYATISQKTEGVLWWKKTYIDKDFYSFDVAVTGTLTITLTEIPITCDYDMRLYKLDNSFATTVNSLNFNNYIASSENAKGADEEISYNVTPGTYYVCVYSFNDATFDNDNPYKITFLEKHDSKRKNSGYYIDTGRYDDIAAIWISDYQPLGLSPITMTNRQAKCKFSNYDTYPYIRHLAENYEAESINYAVLFVWNLSARAYIYSFIDATLNSLLDYSNWANESANSFNIILNKASFAINVGGYIIGEISELLISKAASTLINSLGFKLNVAGFGMSLISFITSFSLENEFQIRRKDLIEYLVNLKAAFEIGKGSNEDQTIMIKFRYHFSEHKYIDWSPRYELGDSNMHGEDYITGYIPGSGINGSVYGVSKVEDLNSYLGS